MSTIGAGNTGPVVAGMPALAIAHRCADDLANVFVANVVDYAILMLDVDGTVATWNAGALRLKGYEADEIIGRHFSAFYPAEDVAAGKPERMLAVAAAECQLR